MSSHFAGQPVPLESSNRSAAVPWLPSPCLQHIALRCSCFRCWHGCQIRHLGLGGLGTGYRPAVASKPGVPQRWRFDLQKEQEACAQGPDPFTVFQARSSEGAVHAQPSDRGPKAAWYSIESADRCGTPCVRQSCMPRGREKSVAAPTHEQPVH